MSSANGVAFATGEKQPLGFQRTLILVCPVLNRKDPLRRTRGLALHCFRLFPTVRLPALPRPRLLLAALQIGAQRRARRLLRAACLARRAGVR